MSVSAPSSGCGSTQSVTSPSEEKKQHPHQNGHRRVRQEKSGAMASSQGKNELRFADWMASLPESIQSMPLTNLAIPGSHDSFSFYIDEASPVGPEQPETVQNFVSVFGTVAKKLMRKWLATQTMNFSHQLEAGIRFFDLRISTKPRDPDNELYFAHGLFSAKVNEGLEQINTFLTSHSREVVFLDFNHFYGMQNSHHEKLVHMLQDIFGNKLCPAIFAQEVSLKYLWEKEYQVLVFYHNPAALEVPFLWPGQMMPSPWANTTDTDKLIQFLQSAITERRKKGTFFVSQVVLTPKASTVMKGVASGLRETITERALPGMMQWVRTQKPGESGINIITADFVELGDFISAVIMLNRLLEEGGENAT
ncbi:PI-PLC X domain-containing protein 3 [Acipenser ruthenus]|nr:PI-PLC X domain-containing protein 3 [Acipenser ruthenus]